MSHILLNLNRKSMSIDTFMDIENKSWAKFDGMKYHHVKIGKPVSASVYYAVSDAFSVVKNYISRGSTLIVNLPSNALECAIITQMLLQEYKEFYAIRWDKGEFAELIFIGEPPF